MSAFKAAALLGAASATRLWDPVDLGSIASVIVICPAVWDKIFHIALAMDSAQQAPMKKILAVPWLLGLQHAVDPVDGRTCQKFCHCVQMTVYQIHAFYAVA